MVVDQDNLTVGGHVRIHFQHIDTHLRVLLQGVEGIGGVELRPGVGDHQRVLVCVELLEEGMVGCWAGGEVGDDNRASEHNYKYLQNPFDHLISPLGSG